MYRYIATKYVVALIKTVSELYLEYLDISILKFEFRFKDKTVQHENERFQ